MKHIIKYGTNKQSDLDTWGKRVYAGPPGCGYNSSLLPSGWTKNEGSGTAAMFQAFVLWAIHINLDNPSGKRSHSYGKSPFLLGK